MTLDSILSELRTKGFRMTQSRIALLGVFVDAATPLTVTDLLAALKAEKVHVNKTTVYREVDFLLEQNLIESVQFGNEDMKRYELALGSHHHHIQCVQCGQVADVDMPEELKNASKTILNKTGFRVLDHSLEFVGICKNCQKT